MAPEKIFLHAVAFDQARRILMDKAPQDTLEGRALAAPTGMMAAFTCELLLKCLICIERGYAPEGHNLRMLFDLLSSNTQKRIEEQWDSYAKRYDDRWVEIERHVGPIDRNLRSALSDGGKTFDLTRYMHEEREEFRFYLGALADMLGKIIFQLRPDWAQTAETAWKALET